MALRSALLVKKRITDGSAITKVQLTIRKEIRSRLSWVFYNFFIVETNRNTFCSVVAVAEPVGCFNKNLIPVIDSNATILKCFGIQLNM